MAVTYRVTTMTDVVVTRRDHITAGFVPVAVGEDLSPAAEIKITALPGAVGGAAGIVRRVNGVNGAEKTVYPNHPLYVNISNLRQFMTQPAPTPYTKSNTTP